MKKYLKIDRVRPEGERNDSNHKFILCLNKNLVAKHWRYLVYIHTTIVQNYTHCNDAHCAIYVYCHSLVINFLCVQRLVTTQISSAPQTMPSNAKRGSHFRCPP